MQSEFDKIAPFENLTKLDVVHRQLSTAIELWFNNKDAVSIYALVCASHEIIHDYSKKKGIRDVPLLFDFPLPDKNIRNQFNLIIKNQCNFFKHSDKDPDKPIEFSPSSPIGLMIATVVGLMTIKEKLTAPEMAFFSWVAAWKPNFLGKNIEDVNKNIPIPVEKIKSFDKTKFFKLFIENWETLKVSIDY